jgi:hypothetical protein
VLDRDTLASLVAPGLDNQPAAPRLHPLAEPMGFCPMPVIRLVCSLWHSLVLLENLKSYTAWTSPSRNARNLPFEGGIHSKGYGNKEKEQNQLFGIPKIEIPESHHQESR